jgi:hypothetical protein
MDLPSVVIIAIVRSPPDDVEEHMFHEMMCSTPPLRRPALFFGSEVNKKREGVTGADYNINDS